MSVIPALKLVLLAGVAAIVVACGDGDRPTRTQNSRVNAVIEAVESHDREALRDLVQLTSLPCTDEPASPDRPRCLGEPAGTNVEVFQANECETSWLRAGDLDSVIDQVIALEPAVYAAFETPEAFYLPGSYAIVFEGRETRVDEPGLKRYFAAGVEGDFGQITGVSLGCGIDEPAHFLLPHQNEAFDGWLIEPP